MNDRRFHGEIERLRSPERLARLEVDRVAGLALDGLDARSLLDVGVGSAVFAEAFAARGLTIAGVDLREDMIEVARHFVPSGDFRLAHMESLPFADESFSLVFLGFVLHEADDVARTLKEAYRVATRRVAVLEWMYAVQDFGPPLEHRLKPQAVKDAATAAGFARVGYESLTSTVLYVFDKAV